MNMPISEQRIQAEVAAEIRRIKLYGSPVDSLTFITWPMFEEYAKGLANHLGRNRLQVEMGVAELRAKGHALGQDALHHPVNCQVTGGCYLCQAQKLEARQGRTA